MGLTMRKVIVHKMERLSGQSFFSKIVIGHGKFHEFGVNCEEFGHGVGNFSTAIVEMPSGEVLSVALDMITFVG